MSRKKNNIHLGLRLDKDLVEKFRALCESERRNYNDQMGIILEEWFASRERPTVKPDDVVPDAAGNTTPGPQPFATPRHRRSGEARPSGKA